MVEITEKVVKSVKIPVTVKTRLGWDENSKNIYEIAEKLQDVGIAALTIHGRTRSQMYTGKADWTLIGEVKNNPRLKIPIIGNGDIECPEDALNMFHQYHVDGIMIGRGAIGKPWIFKHTRHFLETGQILPEPDIETKVNLIKLHLCRSVEDKGEFGGIMTMRRHYVQYLKSLRDIKPIRLKLLTSNTLKENITILDHIAEKYNSHNNSQQVD
jgi:nifR3 family TIM-barrel protein